MFQGTRFFLSVVEMIQLEILKQYHSICDSYFLRVLMGHKRFIFITIHLHLQNTYVQNPLLC